MSEGNDLISLIKLHLCEKLLIVLISILFLLLLFDSRELKSLQLHAIYLQFFIFAYGLTVLSTGTCFYHHDVQSSLKKTITLTQYIYLICTLKLGL